MPMKVEAAIVTQKRPSAEYNTDSVNVNGKVMPREVIRNGYKGSGVLSGSVYFALTSSDVEGFADASVTAFNERAELFSRSREPMSVFSGFFEDCRGALLNMNRSADELVGAGFYASGRRAVIANNGQTKVYLQRLGVTSPVTADKVTDTTADFSGAVFSDVCEGDIFILLSPGAAQVLGDKEIEDILRISDGSVKRAVNYILKVALAAEGDKAVSAIVVKVLETAPEEEIIPAFVPDFTENEKEEAASAEEKAEAEAVTDAADAVEETASEEPSEAPEESIEEASETEAQEEAEEAIADADDISSVFAKNALEMFESPDIISDADVKNDAELYTEEIEEIIEEEPEATEEADTEEKGEPKKSRTPLFIILGIMFAVSLAVIAALIIVPAFSDKGEETTVEETTTEEETTEEETTEEETTDEEITDEETSEEETTAEETTTRKPAEETTTRRPVTENTTAAPVVAPEQTTESETTTEAPEATTAEDTTVPAEETTAAPDSEPSEDVTEEALTEAATEASEETEEVQ